MENWFIKPMKDEVPYEEIEEKALNGEFHEWNYECSPFSTVEYGYDDVLDKLRSYQAGDYLNIREKRDEAKKSGDTENEKKYQGMMDKMIDDVYNIYREKNIYPTAYYSELGIIQEIEKCIAYKAFWDGNTVSCGAGIGTTLCKFLFPNLQDTPSKHDLDKKGAESIFAKFNNEQYLKRAIQFCFSYKDGCPIPTAVEGGLRLVGSAPSNFRPMNAKAVYERFCPEGGTIYDFCCVDDETEFFNGEEWKSLAEYVSGDKVLQYNENGTAELVEPIDYIHYQNDDPFYECNLTTISSCQTGNHDVVYREKPNETKTYKIKQSEILDNFEGYIPTSAMYNGNIEIPEQVLQFISHALLQPIEVFGEKEFSFIYNATYKSKERLLNMLFDGGECITVNATSRRIIKTLCSLSNFYLETLDVRYGEFILKLHKNKDVGCSWHTKYKASDNVSKSVFTEVQKRDKYCFVVPSHMLVLRRKNKVYITGNCGFGGRMLGALSSKKNFKYVGTDPNTETMYHLHQLGQYIEQVTGRENSYELHCCGSEEFKGKPNSIDFAFSSPPYFDLEVYSDEPTQCYNKFPKLEEWLEGYVRQTIKNIAYMLKPGRCYAVNIADFKVSGGECAYVDEWIRLSTEEGMPLFDTVYLGVTARAGSKEQAAGELKKENILIFKKSL